jgi:hypothetical protein
MKKHFLRLMGVVLAMVLIIGTVPVSAAKVKLSVKKKTMYVGDLLFIELKNASESVKWNSTNGKVAVVNHGVVTALSKGKATIYASYKGKNYKCKITVKNKPKMQTPKLSKDTKVGDVVAMGCYEQDNNFDNGMEPIEWRVLDKKDDRCLLISKNIIAAENYETEKVDTTWETCALRKWLNEDFYNTAFNKTEKNNILKTKVINADNARYLTVGGENTKDKIFLLSIDEVETYFSSDTFDYVYFDRCAECSDYVNSKFLVQMKHYEKNFHSWLLRTPGLTPDKVAFVQTNGEIDYSGAAVGPSKQVLDTKCYGVRPAMWVKVES